MTKIYRDKRPVRAIQYDGTNEELIIKELGQHNQVCVRMSASVGHLEGGKEVITTPAKKLGMYIPETHHEIYQEINKGDYVLKPEIGRVFRLSEKVFKERYELLK